MIEKIEEIKIKFENCKNVAIFGHTNADGDAVGSMCAMQHFFKSLNKNADMFVDGDVPERFLVLSNANTINTKEFDPLNYDLLLAVDCSEIDRLKIYANFFKSFENTVLIDHHKSNTKFAKVGYVEPTTSSCGEVIFNLLTLLGYKINAEMASSLFAAMLSDTNTFTNSNVTQKTYKVAGKLIELGADFENIVYYTQKLKTKSQLKLAGFMSSNVQINNGVSYLAVLQKNCKKLGVKMSDVSKFLNTLTDIEGSRITVLIKQKEKNTYNISFRCLKGYNVSDIAQKYGGGGHIQAAACVVTGRLNAIKKNILNECFNEIKRVESGK